MYFSMALEHVVSSGEGLTPTTNQQPMKRLVSHLATDFKAGREEDENKPMLIVGWCYELALRVDFMNWF